VVRGVIALYRDGKMEGYVSAFIYHNCAQFKGAIDMWAGTQLFSTFDVMNVQLAQSIITQGAAFVLKEKVLLGKDKFLKIAEFTRKSFNPPSPIRNLKPIYLSQREK
jgi:hypothetical protein